MINAKCPNIFFYYNIHVLIYDQVFVFSKINRRISVSIEVNYIWFLLEYENSISCIEHANDKWSKLCINICIECIFENANNTFPQNRILTNARIFLFSVSINGICTVMF